MKKRDHKIWFRDKKYLKRRIAKQYEDQAKAMFKDGNIVYELAERTRAIGYGGIGAIPQAGLATQAGPWDQRRDRVVEGARTLSRV